ncbi:MAG: hypothetical protein PHS49_07550 [Candidatus Gracilibacteria bacterium]|nr:hypothetical protein [Candidatus Gracilibacteria bacterium]
MNKFETKFFAKYVPEGQEMKGVFHMHVIDIFKGLFLWMVLGALIPSVLYYYSIRLQEIIPFYFLEIVLFLVYLKIVYVIFDWYNDVWIVTNLGVIELDWKLLKTDSKTVEFEKIEGIEVQQSGIWDKLFKKGDLLIHKIGDDTFLLRNAINPYKCVDFIEQVSQEYEQVKDTHEEHYDLIMDALSGLVENYLEKKMSMDDKQREIEKVIEKVQNDNGTIDLRSF